MKKTNGHRVLGVGVSPEEMKALDEALEWIPLGSRHMKMKAALHIGLVALQRMDQLEAVKAVQQFDNLKGEERFKPH